MVDKSSSKFIIFVNKLLDGFRENAFQGRTDDDDHHLSTTTIDDSTTLTVSTELKIEILHMIVGDPVPGVSWNFHACILRVA